MSKMVAQFDAWHKTRLGYAVMGVLELVVAFALVSRAIDTGSIWQYFFALVFLIGGLQNFYKLIHALVCKKHGKK